MTYAEGASLHPERGGSAVFARYAFNELVSFVAGWAIVLDYTILLAVAALTVPAYLSAFWSPLGHGGAPDRRRVRRDRIRRVRQPDRHQRPPAAPADRDHRLRLGAAGRDHRARPGARLPPAPPDRVDPSRDRADLVRPRVRAPDRRDRVHGLEAAASLAGEVTASAGQVKRLVLPGSPVIVLIYVGIAFVGISALPGPQRGQRARARALGRAGAGGGRGLPPGLGRRTSSSTRSRSAARSASERRPCPRCSASLGSATRWPRTARSPARSAGSAAAWGTPFVVIGAAAVAAAALVVPEDLELLVGIYAFGALLAFTIAHVSVIALRYREPTRQRGYTVPLSVTVRGRGVPIPAVLGALLGAVGLVIVLIFHSGARFVGLGWLLGGLVLYVTYRKTQQKPLFRRVTIPERALRHEALEPEFGSILVPISATPLDDDIVQTAGRLAGETHDDVIEEGAVIEAIWVFEMPLSLPLDAPAAGCPDQEGAGSAGPGQGGGGGVRGGRGGHRDGPRPAGRPGDRRRGAPARRRGDRARGRGALARSRRRTVRRRRADGELRRPDHQVRDQQGAVPGDPDRAAGGLAPDASMSTGTARSTDGGAATPGPATSPRRQRARLERLRQRRLLDLLRAGSGGVARPRADADRVRDQRRDLLPDGGDLLRSHLDVPGGRGVVELRAARVQRVLVVLRGVGADAQLRDHDRDLRVLRPSLSRRAVLSVPEDLARRHLLRDRRGGGPVRDQRRRHHGGNKGQRRAGDRRLLNPGAAGRPGADPGVQSAHPRRERAPGGGADVEELPDRDPGGDDRLHRASRRSRTWPRRPRTRPRRSRRRSTGW